MTMRIRRSRGVFLSVLCAARRLGGTAESPPPTPLARRPSAFYPLGRDRPHGYEITNEEVRYSGWRKVIRRTVSLPVAEGDGEDGAGAPPTRKAIDFDVVDQARASGGAVVIFAWNSTSKTATIVREYMPGPHRVLSGLAAGIVEAGKHSSVEGVDEASALLAARCELEEECHLAGGTWYLLTDEGISVPMDKYAITEITPYLVVDPHHVPNPRPLDDEEDIEIVTGVPPESILRMIREGDFNLVGGWGALLALEKLREIGEIT